jgi:hypothetical protein
MFQNKFISRGAKLKIYWTVVRPVVTPVKPGYSKSEINKLLVFERKIFVPSKENDCWRR